MVLILDRQPTFAAANICLWPKRTFSTVSDHPARSCVFEHYVVQCVSIWARFDSTSELNARSQPSSARPGVGLPVEMESCWPGRAIGGANGCRSPLVARLTEMVITVALSAVTGLGNVLMAPAIRALKRQAAEKLLRTGSLRFARPT